MPVSSSKKDIKGLFDEYYLGLVEFSLKLVHDEEVSRDIVQDVFVKLLEKDILLPSKKIQIKSYLYSMVKNASLNYLRKLKTIHNYAEQRMEEEYAEENILDALIHSEYMNKLHTAISSLPKACREICTLTYLDGKSNQEAAELTQTSINTVKTQKRRAIKLLKGKMSPAVNSLKTIFLLFF